jgi:hypothetical protein
VIERLRETWEDFWDWCSGGRPYSDAYYASLHKTVLVPEDTNVFGQEKHLCLTCGASSYDRSQCPCGECGHCYRCLGIS